MADAGESANTPLARCDPCEVTFVSLVTGIVRYNAGAVGDVVPCAQSLADPLLGLPKIGSLAMSADSTAEVRLSIGMSAGDASLSLEKPGVARLCCG